MKKRTPLIIALILIISIALIGLALTMSLRKDDGRIAGDDSSLPLSNAADNADGAGVADKIKVFVSILPQKYFVERIGGGMVDVSVMVKPGHSPETYEPTPRQMAELADAKIYYRIGLPFEDIWLAKIESLYPKLQIVDTRKGIKLRAMADHEHYHGGETDYNDDHGHGKGLPDPHIWLDPVYAKIQAKTVFETLSSIDEARKSIYENNYESLVEDLDKLDMEIREALRDSAGKKIMVFHPSWGYFCDRYGLLQVPVEIEGKEPGAKEIKQIIEFARKEGIKVIFVQPQFNAESANVIAKSIGGDVVPIDPLAEDYISNLRTVAEIFQKETR